ncbi:MAG: hypothetical protein HGA38_03365 [Candidatus Moranbacteria bacterium]|nr:hypothetical protein [Candidatus Moranbacteria bacterium]
MISEMADPFYLSKAEFGPNGEILDGLGKLPNDPYVSSGLPVSGWQLVSRDIDEATIGNHMIETVDHFIDRILLDWEGISEESAFLAALAKWNPERKRTKCDSPCGADDSERGTACRLYYGSGNLIEASEYLSSCGIFGLVVEPLQNIVYRCLLDKDSHDPLRWSATMRTSTRTSFRGNFATFGRSKSSGCFIEQESPVSKWPKLGTAYSIFGKAILSSV